MSIVKAANELRRVAALAGVSGKFSVVIYFNDTVSQDHFERVVKDELRVLSRTAGEALKTVEDLRLYGIPFEFSTPGIVGSDE